MKELFHTLVYLRWVIRQLDGTEKMMSLLAFIVIISGGTMTALVPQYMGQLVDSLQDKGAVLHYFSILAMLLLGNECFSFIRKYCTEKVSASLWKKLLDKAVRHILRADMSWLSQQRAGALNGRFHHSIKGAVKLVKLYLMDLLPAVIVMVMSILIALNKSYLVGGIIFMALPISAWMMIRQIKSQKGVRIQLLRKNEDLQSKMIELLGGVETIRATNAEGVQAQKMSGHARQFRDSEFGHHQAKMLYDVVKGMNTSLWYMMVIGLSAYQAVEGIISVGDIFTYSLLFNNTMRPINDLHRLLDDAHETAIHTKDLIDLLDIPQDISFTVPTIELPPFQGRYPAIELKNWSFQYGHQKILDEVSLCIPAGAYVGLVGSSGCGKSTIIKSILALYPGKGHLQLFGEDIRHFSREQLAQQIAYVPQTPYITHGTIRENVLLGNKGRYDDEAIEQALRQACLWQEVRQMEGQLDAKISERGNNLSGGQRQRLALARAFLKRDARLLILDEATSALDNITEAQIYRNLMAQKESTKQTIISIAHRLGTLREADNLFVFEKGGRIVQEGTFNALAVLDGPFADMIYANAEVGA